MYIQQRNNIQEEYYKLWQSTTQANEVLQAMTEQIPSGDHYTDCYVNMKSIHHQLHPYQFIQPNYTVIACGCHNGKITIGTSQPIIFSTLAKHVIVLEPDPVNIQALEQYINYAGIENITIIPKAVWHTETIVNFGVHRADTAANRIGSALVGDKIIRVPTTTLNKLATEYGPIDFVHLTINGTENAVLQSATELLKGPTEISIAMLNKNHRLFPIRMKAIHKLLNNNYYIGWADGPPRAWRKMIFYFAVGTKDEEKLQTLGFEKKSNTHQLWTK